MMRVLYKRIEYPSRKDVIKIVPLGDAHLGHYLCNETSLKEAVREIADDPLCFWGGMGDFLDAITRRDKRFRAKHLAPWLRDKEDLVGAQKKRLLEILKPIFGKCLWYIEGNHERSLLQYIERDVYRPICEAISPSGGIALGVGGFISLRFDRKGGGGRTVNIYAHHGYGGGRTEGGKARKLEDLPTRYEADIYLLGHTHSKINFPGTRVRVKKGKGGWTQTDTILSYTGSFLSSLGEDETYAEYWGLPPLSIGHVTIKIHPDSGRMTLTI